MEKPKSSQERVETQALGELAQSVISNIDHERYPIIARRLGDRLNTAAVDYLKSVSTGKNYKEAESNLRYIIGIMGAFNWIKTIKLFRNDGSVEDPQLDKQNSAAFRMKLGPAAAIQLGRVAHITSGDRLLELFGGVGYGTFFLSLMGPPQILDSVDLNTSNTYNLPRTFREAYKSIYDRFPKWLRPSATRPRYVQADVLNLREQVKTGELKTNYTKVFAHPPFGRESTEMEALSKMTEFDGFALWLKSLQHVSEINKEPFTSYSIVPIEWAEAIVEASHSGQNVLTVLAEKLSKNEYYRNKHADELLKSDGEICIPDIQTPPLPPNVAVFPVIETLRFDISIVTSTYAA